MKKSILSFFSFGMKKKNKLNRENEMFDSLHVV